MCMSEALDITTDPARSAALGLLADWAQQRVEGVISRSRVVDHLLDLRSSLPRDDRGIVDRILAEVPGRNLVEAHWWNRCVDACISELRSGEPVTWT